MYAEKTDYDDIEMSSNKLYAGGERNSYSKTDPDATLWE